MENFAKEIEQLKERISALERAPRLLNDKPTDLRFLKNWISAEEMDDLCLRNHIRKAQANNILAGRSQNWKFIESTIIKVTARMRDVEKVIKMEEQLIEMKAQNQQRR